jgi:hypothetical protein
VSDSVLYELDSNEWHYDRVDHVWVCQCETCESDPTMAERPSYADLTAEHTVSDWKPRNWGRHSDTRHLDEPAANVVDLMARLRPYPVVDLDATDAERAA